MSWIIAGMLWTTVVLHGVVDEVRWGVAEVDWEGEVTGYVPVDLLPHDVEPGDEVELRVRTRRQHFRPRRDQLPEIEVPPGAVLRGVTRVRRSGRALEVER